MSGVNYRYLTKRTVHLHRLTHQAFPGVAGWGSPWSSLTAICKWSILTSRYFP